MATLLVIEDSAQQRAEVRAAVEESAAFDTILEAEDGVKGLKLLLSEPVDVVLCDLELPGLDGEKLLRRVRSEGLEGVVAKRLESPYRPGKRTRDWLKIKARQHQEFVIAGYVRGRGRRERLGALVLAVYENGRLVHVGNCGTGFTDAEIDDLLHRLRPLVRRTPPFDDVPKMPRVRRGDVVWVEPELVCEVEFAEWTHDGHLRAPSYLGLREDKSAREVVRETPA